MVGNWEAQENLKDPFFFFSGGLFSFSNRNPNEESRCLGKVWCDYCVQDKTAYHHLNLEIPEYG